MQNSSYALWLKVQYRERIIRTYFRYFSVTIKNLIGLIEIVVP